MKKIVAVLLCLVTALSVLTACSARDEDDKGAIVNMYLFNEIRCFDPLYAYTNASVTEYDGDDNGNGVFLSKLNNSGEAVELLGLIYEGLFRMNADGKVEKALAKSYEFTDDNKLIIKLRETRWSDNVRVRSDDFVFTIKRILDIGTSCDAAVMLFDIKNAKDVKFGDASQDMLGITAPDSETIEIEFEGEIDEDIFLETLASPILVPMREDKVYSYLTDEKGEHIYGNDGQPAYSNEWAKVATSLVCSGPFTIKKLDSQLGQEMTLERNRYYSADPDADEAVDKYVTPYRIIVNYDFTLDQVLEAYNNGTLFYVGALNAEQFEEYQDKLTINDTFTVGTYRFNTDKELFKNADVRRALSLALDRNEIAKYVVGSVPATGIIPPKVFDLDRKSTYRKQYGDIINTSADIEAAKAALKKSGVNGGEIVILARNFVKTDEVGMAEYVKGQWEKLGFTVTVDARGRNMYQTKFNSGEYDVLYTDWQSYSVRAFNTVAPFSVNYSGTALDMEHRDYDPKPNVSGYSDEEFDRLIAEAEKYAEGTRERNDIVFEAEKKLMDDMPVIPLVFNRDYYMASKEISGYKDTYFNFKYLTKMKLKNYEKYLPAKETEAE